MFGGYWNSASESTKYSICHVATQNHMIEGSRNFMSGNSSLYITTLLVLEVIGIVVVYICSKFITWFSKATWLKSHFTIWGVASQISNQPARFGGHKHCGSGDMMVLVYQVILQHLVIKSLYNFMGRSLSR